MKFNKVMKLIIIIVSLIIVFIMINDSLFYNEKKMYENSWNIELPTEMTNIYKWNNQDSFHGDGIRYSQYKLVEFNQNLFSNYSYTKDATFENYVMNIMDENNISDSQRINFNSPYYWKELHNDQNSLLIIYSLNSQELFLIQITA